MILSIPDMLNALLRVGLSIAYTRFHRMIERVYSIIVRLIGEKKSRLSPRGASLRDTTRGNARSRCGALWGSFDLSTELVLGTEVR
jgi:hypothetical protein